MRTHCKLAVSTPSVFVVQMPSPIKPLDKCILITSGSNGGALLNHSKNTSARRWALKDPPRKEGFLKILQLRSSRGLKDPKELEGRTHPARPEGFPKILQLRSSRGLKDPKELEGPTHGPEGFATILQPGVGPEGPTPQGLKDFQKSFSFDRRGV